MRRGVLRGWSRDCRWVMAARYERYCVVQGVWVDMRNVRYMGMWFRQTVVTMQTPAIDGS